MFTIFLFLGIIVIIRWLWNLGIDAPNWWDGSDDDWSDEINRL